MNKVLAYSLENSDIRSAAGDPVNEEVP